MTKLLGVDRDVMQPGDQAQGPKCLKVPARRLRLRWLSRAGFASGCDRSAHLNPPSSLATASVRNVV